jgi:hypothetical protein
LKLALERVSIEDQLHIRRKLRLENDFETFGINLTADNRNLRGINRITGLILNGLSGKY